MPPGKCKLCGNRRRELLRSHLTPAALYRMTQQQGDRGEAPVLVTRRTTVPTSRQVWAYLLRGRCEDRFNAGGENYVLSQVHNGEDFPLFRET